MVPHLVTALTGPINELEQRILDSMPAIERWFRLEWMEHTPTFYSAIDVRNAGYKLGPLDCDLFPDAWHALTPGMLPLAVQAAMAAIEKICPEARNLLIIPEHRLESSAYLMHLDRLRTIFHMAGLNVRFGSISPQVKKSVALQVPGAAGMSLEPVVRHRGRIGVKDFDPCTILLSNSLRSGIPGILEELHQQYLLPPVQAGWSVRRRSRHFGCLEEVCKRFGKLIGVDPWLAYPFTDACPKARLTTRAGVQELASHVEALLVKIRKKHKEYAISDRPSVVVKSDDADSRVPTWTLYDTKQLETQAAQYAAAMPEEAALFLHEGLTSVERVNDAVAQPVVYTMDRYVVGGFYRVQAAVAPSVLSTTNDDAFLPLAFADDAHLPLASLRSAAHAPNRFYMYGVIARLSMLAASYELEATDPQLEAA